MLLGQRSDGDDIGVKLVACVDCYDPILVIGSLTYAARYASLCVMKKTTTADVEAYRKAFGHKPYRSKREEKWAKQEQEERREIADQPRIREREAS